MQSDAVNGPDDDSAGSKRGFASAGLGLPRHEASEAGAAGSPAGAPPCITAPVNSDPRILRHGIDSLYLSFPGRLSSQKDDQLRALKQCAQSEQEQLSAGAQLQLADHLFEVKAHGRRRFPFVLSNNWFDIALSARDAKRLPLAHVQVSSELITSLGVEECTRRITCLIEHLGYIEDIPQVSRVDLFVDFITHLDFDAIPRHHWIKRAKNRAAYEMDDQATGWVFGQGGDISCRLYNKTEEIKKSKKIYLPLLWAEAGWQTGETVWRLEFEFNREALQQLCVLTVLELLDKAPALWRYATTDWLRLAIPNPDDQTRARWNTHPTWQRLSDGFGIDAPTLARVSRQRPPSDEVLFKTGLWPMTSYMAREGITDIDEGLQRYLAGLATYYRRDEGSKALDEYAARKARSKARRYGTRNNRDDEE
ncbi:MAG TPA: hypothetical protein VHE37_09240 [Nevskiaceae bacterium]|nr:hypothetical protein [Nevskiaceae bacterium]